MMVQWVVERQVFSLTQNENLIGLCGITGNKLVMREIKQGKKKSEQRKRK